DDERWKYRVRCGKRPPAVEAPESDADHEKKRKLEKHRDSAADDSPLGIAQAAGGQESLHDQLVGAVRCHREKRAPDESGEERVRAIDAGVRIDQPQLARGARGCENAAPTAGYDAPEENDGGDATADVHSRLEQFGPNYRLHAAAVRVHDREES